MNDQQVCVVGHASFGAGLAAAPGPVLSRWYSLRTAVLHPIVLSTHLVKQSDYLNALSAAADALPPSLEAPVRRWLEDLPARLPVDNLLAPPPAAGVVRLAACSEFAADVIKRDAGFFFSDGEAAFKLPARGRLSEEAAGLVAGAADRASFTRDIRRTRNRGLVRVLWAEFVEQVAVAESLVALTDLAEALLDAAVDFASRQLAVRFGQPVGPDGVLPLIVLGMGKLGGRELNVSSDIDLVFLYPGDGQTDGSRSLSAQEYFTRVSREAIALLEQVTGDGFVYRVDTRLRPFGESGPPVVSFTSLESYLVEHGRSWERYAYVKARPVTRSAETPQARALMRDIVRPFVYRRYLDYGVFESLRDLHKLIVAEVRRQDMADNIKLGPGGIREIEFIVQSLQLVRGGSNPSLQTTGLREALDAAVEDNNLTAADAEELIACYDFLRRVENALQGFRDQQTHDLPTTGPGLVRLACAIGLSGPEALSEQVRATRRRVSERFDEIGSDDDPDGDGLRQAIDKLWAAGADEPEWARLLGQQAFADAEQVASLMAAFAKRHSVMRTGRTAGRRLRQFVTRMLPAIRRSDDAALVLERLIAIAETVMRRSAYLSLLNENPAVLDRLVEICQASAYLSGEIARHPVLLDELIDARIFVDPPTIEDVDDELSRALARAPDDDVEASVDALAEFKRSMLFRVAAADFGGSMPIMKVSDRLTDIAERILGVALALAETSLVQEFGRPTCVDGGERRTAGLGVVAYGKLAGFELSYSSDLDLVFIHDSKGERQQTDGARVIDNGVYFSRLVRRLVHILTTRTGFGVLYEIDTRLRPSGKSGLLVTSLDAFDRYQRESAWTWEHQALLRSRPVAGSHAVATEFAAIRRRTLIERVRRESLRDDVLDMRRRMRKELDRSSAERFDLKQGEGGVGDIEFIVQYLVLANAGDAPAVIEHPDNIRQLDALADAGIVTREAADRLQQIYRDYRAKVHRLALDGRPALVEPDEFAGERQFVGGEWQRVFSEDAGPGLISDDDPEGPLL